jgi:putative ABC transport system permease protein
MQTIWQDLQYGIRGMRKQPSFTALAVLALALGIGAATTIFSVIHNVLLDPFPYPNADRVVTFYIHDVKQSGIGGRSFFRTAEFLEYQNQNHVFEEVIGGGNEDILLTTPEGTEQFAGGYVTANNFTFLGVPPVIGTQLPGSPVPADDTACRPDWQHLEHHLGQCFEPAHHDDCRRRGRGD